MRPGSLPSWPDQPQDSLAAALLRLAAEALAFAALVGLTLWLLSGVGT